MPLAYSNTSAANTALSSYLNPGLSPAAIANAKAKGIGSNLAIGTSGQVITKSPTTASSGSKPVASAPAKSSGIGSYKGVVIKPGTDAEVAAQIKAIDAGNGGTNPGTIAPPVAPAAGLLSSTLTTKGGKGGKEPKKEEPITYGGLVGDLAKVGKEGSQQYQKANEALTQFREGAAEYRGGIYSAPTSARVMQGRDQATQLVNAQREAALAAGVTNALNMTQQQITALTNATQYAKPEVAAYGQTVFNPLTGQYEGGSQGLDPQGNASTLADAVLSGRMSYDDALNSLGYAGAAGAQFLNNAIMAKNPSANINQLRGSAAATQSNTQLAGTTMTGAASQGFTQAIQQYQTMNTNYSAATSQANTVKGILSRTGLNNASSTDYNKALNTLKGRFSSTDFAEMSTALAELQTMYTQILSLRGGTPSGQEAQALAILNPNSSAQAINASIAQLEQAAYNQLNALYQQAQTYQNALQGGNQPVVQGGGYSGSGAGVINSRVGPINTNW